MEKKEKFYEYLIAKLDGIIEKLDEINGVDSYE